MRGVEEIRNGKKLLAIVFRKNITVDGVKFLTDEQNPFQIGVHQRKKGVSLNAHIHKITKPLKIKTIQEVLYIQRGKILVTLYTKSGKVIVKKQLLENDSILLLDVGHGVEFLEDSRIFQVKQGPYLGTVHAKIYLK